mmetsp:Transcript_3634/g.9255  ORF Transcript_3634/g.9255 Transcript_3634/m.9255 type:complete len:347 (-) Transcript_3634:29-1069(-)
MPRSARSSRSSEKRTEIGALRRGPGVGNKTATRTVRGRVALGTTVETLIASATETAIGSVIGSATVSGSGQIETRAEATASTATATRAAVATAGTATATRAVSTTRKAQTLVLAAPTAKLPAVVTAILAATSLERPSYAKEVRRGTTAAATLGRIATRVADAAAPTRRPVAAERAALPATPGAIDMPIVGTGVLTAPEMRGARVTTTPAEGRATIIPEAPATAVAAMVARGKRCAIPATGGEAAATATTMEEAEVTTGAGTAATTTVAGTAPATSAEEAAVTTTAGGATTTAAMTTAAGGDAGEHRVSEREGRESIASSGLALAKRRCGIGVRFPVFETSVALRQV